MDNCHHDDDDLSKVNLTRKSARKFSGNSAFCRWYSSGQDHSFRAQVTCLVMKTHHRSTEANNEHKHKHRGSLKSKKGQEQNKANRKEWHAIRAYLIRWLLVIVSEGHSQQSGSTLDL
jgi:hypothetical protein